MKYVARTRLTSRRHGRDFLPGEMIELEPGEAAPLLAAGAIEPLVASTAANPLTGASTETQTLGRGRRGARRKSAASGGQTED